MSIENITQKIIQEAELSARQVISEAEAKSRALVSDAEGEGVAILEAKSLKAKEDAQLIKSRKVSVAELESRKMMLSAKQNAVTRSFERAIAKIFNMPEDEYIEFLSSMIDDLGVKGGEIVLNVRDKERVGEKLVKKVNGNSTGGFTLSDKTLRGAGGFILQSQDVELNCTVETIINSVKEELTLKVVEALFK